MKGIELIFILCCAATVVWFELTRERSVIKRLYNRLVKTLNKVDSSIQEKIGIDDECEEEEKRKAKITSIQKKKKRTIEVSSRSVFGIIQFGILAALAFTALACLDAIFNKGRLIIDYAERAGVWIPRIFDRADIMILHPGYDQEISGSLELTAITCVMVLTTLLGSCRWLVGAKRSFSLSFYPIHQRIRFNQVLLVTRSLFVSLMLVFGYEDVIATIVMVLFAMTVFAQERMSFRVILCSMESSYVPISRLSDFGVVSSAAKAKWSGILRPWTATKKAKNAVVYAAVIFMLFLTGVIQFPLIRFSEMDYFSTGFTLVPFLCYLAILVLQIEPIKNFRTGRDFVKNILKG